MCIIQEDEIKNILRNDQSKSKEIKKIVINSDYSLMISLHVDGSFEYFDLNKKENESSSYFSFASNPFSWSNNSSNKTEKLDPIPCDIVFPNDSQCLCKIRFI
jgi:hypothetical protein